MSYRRGAEGYREDLPELFDAKMRSEVAGFQNCTAMYPPVIRIYYIIILSTLDLD